MSEMFRNMQELEDFQEIMFQNFYLLTQLQQEESPNHERARQSDESGIIDTLNFKLIKQRVRF